MCTGGELEIVVHGGGSLFKGNEIKRAVQTGQAPIGERLLSAHQNENPLFGFDSVPFLASSFEASDRLWRAARDRLEEVLLEQNLILLYAVPWPPQGLYFNREISGVGDMAGTKFRTYNAATAMMAELAGMVPVQIEAAETQPGTGDRGGGSLRFVGRDRLRPKGLGTSEPLLRCSGLASAQLRACEPGCIRGPGRPRTQLSARRRTAG